jgi:hypothetical protein
MPALVPASTSAQRMNSSLRKFLLLPHADVILRSWDSHDFPVQQLYVINSSPILREQIMATTSHSKGPKGKPQPKATSEETVNCETLLPVVQLPENHRIISNLLTFLFPVPPILPTSREQILELLAVAQKYQASTALTRIRDCVAKLEPKFIRSETALQVYSLAWKYELREEALLAAEETLVRLMTFKVFDDKLNVIPSAALFELWKFRQRVLDNVGVSLGTEYSCHDTDVYKVLLGFRCDKVKDDKIPEWLCHYLNSIIKGAACLDTTTFYLTVSSHVSSGCRHCKPFPGKTTRKLWTALADVFHESKRRVSSTTMLNAIVRGESHPSTGWNGFLSHTTGSTLSKFYFGNNRSPISTERFKHARGGCHTSIV